MKARLAAGVAGACLAGLLAVVLAAGAGGGGESPRVLVLAGSASRPVLDEAAAGIRSTLGIEMSVDYGGSGAQLARLELARRGDIYLPGSDDFLERAIARELVDPASRVDLAYLVPALLVRTGNPKEIRRVEDLFRPGVRAAIAEPRTACAGLYAVEILRRAGVPERETHRLGRARSCAAVADLLALGNVDAILGWRVFAAWFPGRLEIVPLPDGLVTRVAVVPGAVTTFAAHPEEARRVLAWLASPGGRALWRRHGYTVDRVHLATLAPGARTGS